MLAYFIKNNVNFYYYITLILYIIHFILIPACFIESAFLYTILMSLLNMNLTHKKNLLYTFFFSIIGVILYILIPAPFNTILYYIFVCFLLKLLLNVKLMKGFLTIIISLFIIASINLLIQKPYMTILNIDNDTYMNTPIYRILYLAIFYFLLFGTNKIIKKVKKTDFSIEPLDVLDKQTFVTIYQYIGFAFLCLIIELLLTAFYIDKIPVAVTIFNFCLIFSIFLLSLFILSRVITLETTKKSLQSAEEYNKSLTILYDEVKGFNHDFKNIVSAIDGYICTNNIDGLKKGRYDIIFGSYSPDENGIDFVPIIKQEIVAILPPGHPLTLKDTMEATDFADYPVLGYARHSGLGKYTRSFFKKHDVSPNFICESPDENGIASLVAQGFGIALVADVDAIHRDDICIRHLVSHESFSHTVYMGYMTGKFQLPAIKRFIEFVRKSCS